MTNSIETLFHFAGYCYIHKPELASELNTLLSKFINEELDKNAD